MKTKQILLASRPKGMPDFNSTSPSCNSGRSTVTKEKFDLSGYISVDPYMRGRMSDRRSYIDPFEVDKPINGGVVARVEDSRSSSLNKGDMVFGMLPWATYTVAKAASLSQIFITPK